MTHSSSWLPTKQEIYSYATAENLGAHAARALPFLRRKYRWRALLLLLPAMIEFPYFLYLTMTRGAPRRYAFLNKRSLGILNTTAGQQTLVIGSLIELPIAWRKGALWVPVSGLYIALAWSKWTTQGDLPWAARHLMNALCRALASRLSGNGWLITHSDALPLARALAAIARHIGARTCCVAHGIFHEQFPLPEIDGSRSDVNVVHSETDARIIQRANPRSIMLIEPELFRPPRPRTVSTQLRVSLIGEAWHTCDKAFDRLHLGRLREFEAALIRERIEVSFRPHPSERYRAWLYGFRRLDFGSKHRAFERFNVFIGYASTLLNEADAVGHLAIQLVHPGHVTPMIVRDKGREIPRVQTPEALLDVLTRARQFRSDIPPEAESDRALAVARVLAALRGTGGLPSCP